jgi:hypothetical protein
MEKRKRKKIILVFIFTSLNLVNPKVYIPENLEYKALDLSYDKPEGLHFIGRGPTLRATWIYRLLHKVNLKVYSPKNLYRNHAKKFQNSSGAVLELMFFTSRDEDDISFLERYFLIFPQKRSFALFDEDLMLPFVGMIRRISARFKLKYS